MYQASCASINQVTITSSSSCLPLKMDEDPWADGAAHPDSTTVSHDHDAGPAGESTPSTSTSSAPASSRPSRLMPRRLVAQPTRLQAVEDDPLGPLGASAPTGDGALPPLAPRPRP
ncbi:hypothetical protein B0T19DRAFT_442215 [Cercophora scortea]|uniref:Uncharacterized protein n=1 Tax=Cercophora scortea TaxID=314031 RepID=A0AAE0INT9_9PEZI|nr:hypothetical protein B0T19DRAFT_442215 [Cercophora scortea]